MLWQDTRYRRVFLQRLMEISIRNVSEKWGVTCTFTCLINSRIYEWYSATRGDVHKLWT